MTGTFVRPLVALSLTDSDRELIRYAACVAPLIGCEEMRFVHVVTTDHQGPSPEEIEQIRARMTAEVGEHFGREDVALSFDVTHGARLDEILGVTVRNNHDLLLLGHRRARSGRRSLARRLAMVAPCSVWLVPEGAAEDPTEVLVPVDFSRPSADALQVAAAIVAARGGKRLTAVHVYFDSSAVRYDEHVEEVRGQEEQAFGRFLAGIDHKGIEVQCRFEESTDPARAILRVGARQGSNLIVMSTRGRSRATAVLLGSVTSETIAATGMPLLAIKHFGSNMTVVEALVNHRFWNKSTLKTN